MTDPEHVVPIVAREFDVDGVPWRATLSGASEAGGAAGKVIECVDFRPTDGSDGVALRALLPRGRLPDLDETELRELHRTASPIQAKSAPVTDADPEAPPGRERAVIEYPGSDD